MPDNSQSAAFTSLWNFQLKELAKFANAVLICIIASFSPTQRYLPLPNGLYAVISRIRFALVVQRSGMKHVGWTKFRSLRPTTQGGILQIVFPGM